MCEYCGNIYTPLIEPQENEQLQLEVGIEVYNDEDLNEVGATLDADLLYEWSELITKKVKINYCPICGRKFGRP